MYLFNLAKRIHLAALGASDTLRSSPPPNIVIDTSKEDAWVPLKQFFNNQISDKDIAPFKDLPIANKPVTHYQSLECEVSVPPGYSVSLYWQWEQHAMVGSIHLGPPFTKSQLRQLMPRNRVAKRIALVVYNEEHVMLNYIYVLHGIISKDDPVHLTLKDDKP